MIRYLAGALAALLLTTTAAAALCGNTNTCEPYTSNTVRQGNSIPTAAAGTGAGTGAGAPVLTGTDTAGTISETNGTGPATSSPIVTVTFGSSWKKGTTAAAPVCMIFPTNLNAITAQDTAATSPLVTTTVGPPATMVITSGSSALTASVVYTWNYHCL